MRTLEDAIEHILDIEGGYTNDPADSGGETNWGITVATARQAGFKGSMKDMTRADAEQIYIYHYITKPHFDKVFYESIRIGMEVIDTGVNMGQGVAALILQRSLNCFNNQAQLYPDVTVDGRIGTKTIYALQEFLRIRGSEGEKVLLRCMNALQGERYVRLVESRQKDERFIYGWFLNRVVI